MKNENLGVNTTYCDCAAGKYHLLTLLKVKGEFDIETAMHVS